MKKIIYVIIVLSLFGCNSSDNGKPVLLNIKVSGEIEVVPNIASISVDASCTDKGLSKSNDCTKKSIDKLFELLNEHKILKEDYHSSRIALDKEYIWENNSQVFIGYKSSSTINVLFKNLDVMSPVISKIMTMENTSVYNLNYSHSEIESLSNTAYLKALDNSKTLANEIKNKLSGKSVEVSKISNISDRFGSHDSGLLDEEKRIASNISREPSEVQVNPGALKLIKDIYVQYRISF